MTTRLLSIVVTTLSALIVSVSLAQRPADEIRSSPLDAGTVAVRLILGVGDQEPTDWSGRATLDRGEVLDVEGLRFRDGDQVTGRDSWKARSRLVPKGGVEKGSGQGQPKAELSQVHRAGHLRPGRYHKRR